MMRAPDQADIRAAELKLSRSRTDARDSLARARHAASVALTRPSTLLAVGAVAGLLAFFLGRRSRPVAAPPPDSVATTAAKTSVIGLVLAFLVRYGMQHLPGVVSYAWRTHRERAQWQRRDQMSAAENYPASGLRH